MKSVCLAILNFNGRKHLEFLLPTACVAARNYSGPCTVLVLDNGSTAPEVEWIRQEFPEVEIVQSPRNDYLFSYNWLAGTREEDILLLLNNDLKLSPDFIQPLVRHFVFEDVFAVSAAARDWDDAQFCWGPVALVTHHGTYRWDFQLERQERCHTLFAIGGHMAVDRKKFLKLGGFNLLFWPAYGEDVDLCFQAWRQGWRCIFEPASLVLHRGSGTWGTEGDHRMARLVLRSGLLFQWIFLPRTGWWLERAAFYSWTGLRLLLLGSGWWIRQWIATWWEWQGLKRRQPEQSISARELSELLSKMRRPVPEPPGEPGAPPA